MISGYELDPFQHKLVDRGLQSSGSISHDDLRDIVSNVDCIKHHAEFVNFVERYWQDILANQESILSIFRILTAVEDICKMDLDPLVEGLAKQYESILAENPLAAIDVDIMFNMIRCFVDRNRSVKLCLLALSIKIKSLKLDNELSDTLNVVNNHRDVLEKIYDNNLLLEYGQVLDDAITETFRL